MAVPKGKGGIELTNVHIHHVWGNDRVAARCHGVLFWEEVLADCSLGCCYCGANQTWRSQERSLRDSEFRVVPRARLSCLRTRR